jgi:hypothetical protein
VHCPSAVCVRGWGWVGVGGRGGQEGGSDDREHLQRGPGPTCRLRLGCIPSAPDRRHAAAPPPGMTEGDGGGWKSGRYKVGRGSGATGGSRCACREPSLLLSQRRQAIGGGPAGRAATAPSFLKLEPMQPMEHLSLCAPHTNLTCVPRSPQYASLMRASSHSMRLTTAGAVNTESRVWLMPYLRAGREGARAHACPVHVDMGGRAGACGCCVLVCGAAAGCFTAQARLAAWPQGQQQRRARAAPVSATSPPHAHTWHSPRPPPAGAGWRHSRRQCSWRRQGGSGPCGAGAMGRGGRTAERRRRHGAQLVSALILLVS